MSVGTSTVAARQAGSMTPPSRPGCSSLGCSLLLGSHRPQQATNRANLCHSSVFTASVGLAIGLPSCGRREGSRQPALGALVLPNKHGKNEKPIQPCSLHHYTRPCTPTFGVLASCMALQNSEKGSLPFPVDATLY